MHAFTDIADRSTTFILGVLRETSDEIIAELETSGATRHVKNLQMIQLHRAITAVGLFSMFEAILQDNLGSKYGFREAAKILVDHGDSELEQRFRHYRLAVNVLKHGRGESYERLLSDVWPLPFRLKGPDEDFFEEGDVGEISTLVEVDDGFVEACADLVRDVSRVIQLARPDVMF